MELFRKDLNEITYEDIEKFIAKKISEGTRVEYKGEFPGNKNLAKEIAAFANTHGGIILIGIEEENRVPVSIKGIPKEQPLEEKIESICFDLIDPPVFPEVKACKIPYKEEKGKEDNKKVVVLIRIQESDIPPHTVEGGEGIYLRMNDQKKPLKRATYEEVLWLSNKREKAIKNKKRLISRAKERFMRTEFPKELPFLTIHICPLYPYKPLFSLESLQNLHHLIPWEILNTLFPVKKETRTQHESIITTMQYQNPLKIHHMEINYYGLIWFKQNFLLTENAIDICDLSQKLTKAMTLALYIYEKAGYWGNIEMGIILENVQNTPLTFPPPTSNSASFMEPVAGSFSDNEFCITRITSLIELKEKEKQKEFLLNLFREILWNLGYSERSEGYFLQIFEKIHNNTSA